MKEAPYILILKTLKGHTDFVAVDEFFARSGWTDKTIRKTLLDMHAMGWIYVEPYDSIQKLGSSVKASDLGIRLRLETAGNMEIGRIENAERHLDLAAATADAASESAKASKASASSARTAWIIAIVALLATIAWDVVQFETRDEHRQGPPRSMGEHCRGSSAR